VVQRLKKRRTSNTNIKRSENAAPRQSIKKSPAAPADRFKHALRGFW
jgi:hypothetical protein